jgi:hypothetical protein
MAEETILSFNITNWVTVVLMAAIAFAGLGLAQKYYQKQQGQ